jgi:hypothetical protein
MRNDGRRRVAIALVDHHLHPVGGQYFERARKRGNGQRMRVDAQEQRPRDALLLPMSADGLGDGEDVRFVEGPVEGRAALTGGAEGHALRGHARVGSLAEVGGDQARYVDEQGERRGLARQGTSFHRFL